MRLKLKEKEINENLSEKEFLKVLNIALRWGSFGVHRIYVKKIFSGILCICVSLSAVFFCFIWFFLANFYSLGSFGSFYFAIIFIMLYGSHLFYVKDLIYIVMGRFKDKEGKVIKENCCKDENSDDEKISPLDLNVLLRLTRIGRGGYPACFGVYLFYAGHFKKGLFYIALNILDYAFLVLGVLINMNLLYIIVFIFVCQIFVCFLVSYDRRLIKRKMFKDKDGKIICVKRTDERHFH